MNLCSLAPRVFKLRQAVLVKIQEAMTTCLQTPLHQVLFQMMIYVISNKLKCSAVFQCPVRRPAQPDAYLSSFLRQPRRS